LNTPINQPQFNGRQSEVQAEVKATPPQKAKLQAELQRVLARDNLHHALLADRRISPTITEVGQDRLIKEARKARTDFIYTALEQGWLKLRRIVGALKGFKHLGQDSPKAIKRTRL
jgi:hypothetical protein